MTQPGSSSGYAAYALPQDGHGRGQDHGDGGRWPRGASSTRSTDRGDRAVLRRGPRRLPQRDHPRSPSGAGPAPGRGEPLSHARPRAVASHDRRCAGGTCSSGTGTASAPLELNQVGGVGARVVQRGRESDTALVARVLGREVGGKGNILVLNDEAHHAYRIRRDEDEEARRPSDEDELAEADRQRGHGVDRGARPHPPRPRHQPLRRPLGDALLPHPRPGTTPDRPFPWIVSDFGLIDAIESGLVKIPQLPVQRRHRARDPRVLPPVEVDRRGPKLLDAASAAVRRGQVRSRRPILQAGPSSPSPSSPASGARVRALAGRGGPRRPPPGAARLHRGVPATRGWPRWSTSGSAGAGRRASRRRSSRSFATREASSLHGARSTREVVEELSSRDGAGATRSRRLRFVLDTIGGWHGDWPLEDYVELVEQANRKASRTGAQRHATRCVPPGPRRALHRLGRRCSPRAGTADTVTHIVGLRAVRCRSSSASRSIGRGLRRSLRTSRSTDRCSEEVAKVYGVPFELIPLKATPRSVPTPPPKVAVTSTPSRRGATISRSPFPASRGMPMPSAPMCAWPGSACPRSASIPWRFQTRSR